MTINKRTDRRCLCLRYPQNEKLIQDIHLFLVGGWQHSSSEVEIVIPVDIPAGFYDLPGPTDRIQPGSSPAFGQGPIPLGSMISGWSGHETSSTLIAQWLVSMYFHDPRTLKNGTGGGGWPLEPSIPFSLLWGRVNTWNWGPKSHLPCPGASLALPKSPPSLIHAQRGPSPRNLIPHSAHLPGPPRSALSPFLFWGRVPLLKETTGKKKRYPCSSLPNLDSLVFQWLGSPACQANEVPNLRGRGQLRRRLPLAVPPRPREGLGGRPRLRAEPRAESGETWGALVCGELASPRMGWVEKGVQHCMAIWLDLWALAVWEAVGFRSNPQKVKAVPSFEKRIWEDFSGGRT